ncbi:MAG TPA: ATP-grasp domain-containing protein [Clostridiales bacterium]|nr:ATP-grasp domain-containing protein [Clostridiales bacterium]
MNDKLMILGAGRGQLGLIKAAKELGYTTVITSIKGNYPGFDLADEICYADISKPEEILSAAKQTGVSGIATACLDTGIAALGYSCENLGFCGLSKDAAERSGDKLLMKTAFMENNVSTARFMKVSTTDDIRTALATLNLPLIVKAVDLQGSRGIYIANSEEEVLSGFKNTMSETKQSFCIIEEFIEGYEFGAQAFIYNGEILFVLPCGDDTYLSHTAVPVGHYAPIKASDDLLKQADIESRKAIKAIGLDNCAVNIDLIMKNNKVYVIELTGRVGANCLPELVSIYYNVEYYKMIADMAMGKDPRPYFNKKQNGYTANYAKMLLSENSGTLKKIVNKNKNEEYIEEITFFIKEGEQINKFTNSKDCLGQVIVKGKTLDECTDLMNSVISNIEFELE